MSKTKKAQAEQVSATVKGGTLNELAVRALSTVFLQGDKQQVIEFKDALVVKEQQCIETIRANYENGVFDSKGAPKGSAPNDIYNTISEAALAIELVSGNKERAEVAANTVRAILAQTCAKISQFKASLTGGTVKTKSTSAQDTNYL